MNRRLVAAAVLSAAFVSPALAQVNPEIANCQEIRDPDTQTQVAFCTAHVGCQLVMNIHKACVAVKGFFDRFKRLSFGKKEPDMNDVFEAAAPPVTNDTAYSLRAGALKDAYESQPAKQSRTTFTERGTRTFYSGPIVDGRYHGTGIMVQGQTLFRGEWVQGRQVGQGERVAMDSQIRMVGDFKGFELNGNGIKRERDGRFEGQFNANSLDGQGTLELYGKWRYEGQFAAGRLEGRGTIVHQNGNRTTGEFRAGRRYNTRDTDASGNVIAVHTNGVAERPVASAFSDSSSAVSLSDVLQFFGTALEIANQVQQSREARRSTSGSGGGTQAGGSSTDRPATERRTGGAVAPSPNTESSPAVTAQADDSRTTTQTPAARPGRQPPALEAPRSGVGATGCVALERSGKVGMSMRNVCGYGVYVRWCVENPKSAFSCARGQSSHGATDISPGVSHPIVDYGYDGGGQVYLAACASPAVVYNWRGGDAHFECRR